MKKIAVVLASLLVVACASSPKTNSSQASQSNNTSAAANANAAAVSAVENAAPVSAAAMELSKMTAELQQLEKQSDYFDFNKFAVKPEYQDVIQKEAGFIKDHKGDVVTLQGNADERGSAAYNLVLGSKRAEAVAKHLEMLGVPATQIKIVSLGEEKARLTCHAEKCWKENRRVDFIHNLN